MKIIFLVNQDVYANYALNLLLPKLAQHQKYVFYSSSVGKQTSRPEPLQTLAYWEQEWFNNSVCTAIDQETNQTSKYRSWSGLGGFLVEPVTALNHINTAEGHQIIESISPDLIVSIRFGKILQHPIISIPKHGVINLHSGLLPQYRGVMATFWSMLNGEKQIGTSLHQITDEAIDKGILLSQAEQPLQENKSYLENTLSLYPGGVDMIFAAIESIDHEAFEGFTDIQNNRKKSGYFTFPEPEKLKKFMQVYALYDRRQLTNWVIQKYGVSVPI